MKVICIDEDAWPTGIKPNISETEEIKDGNIYYVTDAFIDEGYVWYILSGFDQDYGWFENCFARCSDINEMATLTQVEKNTL